MFNRQTRHSGRGVDLPHTTAAESDFGRSSYPNAVTRQGSGQEVALRRRERHLIRKVELGLSPMDLFMELSTDYERSAGQWKRQVYASRRERRVQRQLHEVSDGSSWNTGNAETVATEHV